MAKTPPPAKTTRFGRRKLSQKDYEAQGEKKRRTAGTTTYGNRKGNAKQPQRQPARESTPHGLPEPSNPEQAEVQARAEDTTIGTRRGGEGKTPSAPAWEDLSIGELEAVLDSQPALLDQAIEAEGARSEPRAGAVKVLVRAEKARDGGPRDGVLAALKQLAE